MRIGLTGGGDVGGQGRRSRRSRRRPTGSPRCGTPAWSPATRSSRLPFAGRETATIELGTAVLQTYPCHPLLQANRARVGRRRDGAAGLHPRHRTVARAADPACSACRTTIPAATPRSTCGILTGLLRGEAVDVDGGDWTAHTAGRAVSLAHPVPVLVSALGPRLLRVAGELADGTVLWMAPPRRSSRTSPRGSGPRRPRRGRRRRGSSPGLPVAVHDDEAEARSAAAANSTMYAGMANYQRILEIGGAASPADAAIVGNEAAVPAPTPVASGRRCDRRLGRGVPRG